MGRASAAPTVASRSQGPTDRRVWAAHLGEIEWGDALRSGAIEVKGSRALARALPTWNRRGWAADGPGAGFGPAQHQPAPTPAATPA